LEKKIPKILLLGSPKASGKSESPSTRQGKQKNTWIFFL